jgi:hypothetical protein
VTQQFLDGSDIVTGFKQVSREGMPQRVATRWLSDPCSSHSLLHRFLNHGFVEVMAALDLRFRIEI